MIVQQHCRLRVSCSSRCSQALSWFGWRTAFLFKVQKTSFSKSRGCCPRNKGSHTVMNSMNLKNASWVSPRCLGWPYVICFLITYGKRLSAGCQIYYQRNLFISGRSTVLNSLLLSRAWHTYVLRYSLTCI